MVEYLRAEELAGGYEIAADRAEQLDAIYDSTSELLGCDATEVAFVASASDAWWRAFSAVSLVSGDRVLISRSEFQSNAFGFLQARERGVDVVVVPNDGEGLIDLDALTRLLDDRVKLVSLTQISMSNGAVQPAAAVGALVCDHRAVYLLDACQAVGQLPVNVDELGCDFLVYTGRKWMRGPRGTGVLYARSSVLSGLGPQPFIDGRSADWRDDDTYELLPGARRFEFAEQHVSGKVGLDVATRYLLNVGIDAVAERIQHLRSRLARGLAELAGLSVLDEGRTRCGIVTFTVRGEATMAMQTQLREAGLNVSAPGRRNAQHDLGARGIDAVLRAAVHYFNTEDEVDRAVQIIAGL